MFARLLGRSNQDDDKASTLYESIVAQARHPTLYAQYSVPDTVEGRFEMIVLHSVILFHRLRRDGDAGQALSQGIFDAFTVDMDRSLREMGVSDLSVPKRMKAMGRSFYGRAEAYGEPLAAKKQTALAEALHRNLFPDAPPTPLKTLDLAAYSFSVVAALREQSLSAIEGGQLDFPEPPTGEPKTDAP